MLSRPAASPQPSKMLLLPGCALPSSAGELSPTNTTRPLPYSLRAAITPVFPCARPFIQNSPRTRGFAAGLSTNVVPLWNDRLSATPYGPCVTESAGDVSSLPESCVMLLFVSPVDCEWMPSSCVGSSAFQIFGESKPSPLRSELSWSTTATRPPPSAMNCRIAADSPAVNFVFGSHTTSTSHCDRS